MTAVNVMEISQRMKKNYLITSIQELIDSLIELDILNYTKIEIIQLEMVAVRLFVLLIMLEKKRADFRKESET